MDAVSQLAPSYEVVWVNQMRLMEVLEQEHSNKGIAERIVAEVNAAVHT